MSKSSNRSVIADDEVRIREVAADIPRNAVPINPEILQNAILNSADFAIIATDAKGIIQLFNVGAERLLGYAASDVVNKITPSDIHDLQEVIARAEGLSAEFKTTITPGFDALAFKASRGIEDKYELTYIRKDGSRFPALVSITALRDDQAKIIGYLLIGTDDAAAHLIAANKEIAAAQMFRLAVESCTSGMVIADGAGKIVLVNVEIERLSGYRRDELIGQAVDILVPARLRTEYARHCDAVTVRRETGRIGASFDFLGLRKDGTEIPIEVGLNPVQVGAGLLVLSVIVDISNRRRMERLKDEFVATVSHELRTPLTSIAGALGLLTADAAGKLPEHAARLVTIAYTNSQRLVRLLNDILDIAKMESGKVVFDFKRVEVRTIIEQTIEANRGFAKGCNVRIRLDSSSAVVDVRADPDRLVQAITNLLSNAIKFSPSGEEVVVAIETRGEMVHISVRDHGRGVPDEFKPRIFEKFAQADATDARQKGGTGLGLSIVKEIVDRLDGAVGFKDAPGGGTIFHVELPSWARAIRAQSHHLGKSHLRVLLCEDDPEAAIVLVDRLRQEGFLADVALTANEAVARVTAAVYTAILVDLQLPEGDGISLIKQLRAQPRIYNTLLVVLSADLQPARDEERPSTLLNILDWLDTPIDVTHLLRVLDRPIARNGRPRPRILHVDSDRDALRVVAKALGVNAEVMSVDSINEARRALVNNRFDVAVLDVALAVGTGSDLLHELRDAEGDAIPLVVFSPRDENLVFAARVRSALIKSRTSIDILIATLRKRLVGSSLPSNEKDAA